jgi:4-hydroxybenzoate polyprenyltransferase
MKFKFIILFIYVLTTSSYAFNNNLLQMNMKTNKHLHNISPINNNKLKHYYILTRPSGIIYEFALPIVGSYLSTKKLSILFDPNVILLGLLSVIIASNCMIINDYYDYICGSDSLKKNKVLNQYLLSSFEVFHTSTYITLFSYYLISIISNNSVRFILSNSIILGYLYTIFFKKILFLKNIVVSFIITQSLVVGCLIVDGNLKLIIPAIVYLFNLIIWQEIILDINDIEDDKINNINTIPVKYGYKNANKIAMVFLLLGTIIPYGISFKFILLQSPLILMNFYVIQKDKIINKVSLNISKFIMLITGVYMNIL